MIDIYMSISEVVDILKHTDEKIVKKINPNFLSFLNKNKSPNYIVNIDYLNKNWKNELDNKTKAILALIYRDYIVSKEEKERLIEIEKEKINKIEEEKREKYNPNNLFKKDDNTMTNTKANQDIKDLCIIELPWYKKILEKLKHFFEKK